MLGNHGGGRSAIWDQLNTEILTIGAGGAGGLVWPRKNYQYLGGCTSLVCVPYPRSCNGGAGGGLVGQDGEGRIKNTHIHIYHRFIVS